MLVTAPSVTRREGRKVSVIAHRGASGYRPENTLAAFELALQLGADAIELDVVPTQDGQLIVRHENELSKTTDVAMRPEFADRRTTKVVDTRTRTGWFTEDFTLAELRVLRTKERMRATRAANHPFDGLYPVPSLEEAVAWASRSRTRAGGRLGLYVEIKHSTYFRTLGLPLEEAVLTVLNQNGYGDPAAPVWIESAEVSNLKHLARLTDISLIQLIRGTGRPQDLRVRGDGRRYADLVTKEGLRDIRRYAVGVGLSKEVAIPRAENGLLLKPASVVRDAHRLDLVVLGWTFRRENRYLPLQFRVGSNPYGPGDLVGETRAFLSAGIDGVFTDHPDVSRTAVASAPRHRLSSVPGVARLWNRVRRRHPGEGWRVS